MITAYTVFVGVMGLLLNIKVVRDLDWGSEPYSFYRHFQFGIAGIGALGWSYCLVGIIFAHPLYVLMLGTVIVPLTIMQYRLGSDNLSRPFEAKYRLFKERMLEEK